LPLDAFLPFDHGPTVTRQGSSVIHTTQRNTKAVLTSSA